MARKKSTESSKHTMNPNVEGLHAEILEQPICDTLELNYMPYAMSVIVSRAIPEIDGFKPSHRKLLYTMYKMGLLNGNTIKSANIVGRTMQLNPHGDAAIYETLVRLSEGNQALLHPYVASKGSFGKAYSRDMAYAASRYTEAKLAPIANELFCDIEKDTVDFTDNYDGSMKEPTLLPVTFPSVLVNANTGIAVGMASSICPFNLREVCETTIAYIRDNDINVADTLLAPDFPIGGQLLWGVAADLGAVQQDTAHAHDDVAAHRTAVHHGVVPHRDVVAQNGGHPVSDMDGGVVLHVGVFAYNDGRKIAADAGAAPHACPLAQRHVPRHVRAAVDKGAGVLFFRLHRRTPRSLRRARMCMASSTRFFIISQVISYGSSMSPLK